MKYIPYILLSLAGGFLGAYIYTHLPDDGVFGATTARTTITNQWTFSATTTNSANLVITTTNSATSSVQVGCVQGTATSTATPVHFSLTSAISATSTFEGTSQGFVTWAYGKCPKI